MGEKPAGFWNRVPPRGAQLGCGKALNGYKISAYTKNRLLGAAQFNGDSMSVRHCLLGLIFTLSVGTPLFAQTTDVEFFEAKIRPVLAQRCYGCHNSKMAAPKGSLILDTKEGLLKGGVSGPAIVPGKPADSRLMQVLSYADPLVQMPPTGKLPDAMLADFAQWIAAGAVDPRVTAPAPASASPQYKGMSLEDGRKWWAFQPVRGARRAEGRAGARMDDVENRWVCAGQAPGEKPPALAAGGQAHAGDARVRRSSRLQADVRRSAGVCERSDAERLRQRSSIACRRRRTTASGGAATGWTWRGTPKTTRHRKRRILPIRLRGGIATGLSKR